MMIICISTGTRHGYEAEAGFGFGFMKLAFEGLEAAFGFGFLTFLQAGFGFGFGFSTFLKAWLRLRLLTPAEFVSVFAFFLALAGCRHHWTATFNIGASAKNGTNA